MSNDTQSLQSLWQKIPSKNSAFTAEQMQSRAREFQVKHKRRDLIEYISWAAFFGLVIYMLTVQSDWQNLVASALASIGAVIAIWNYKRFMGVKVKPAAKPSGNLLGHMQRELTRQRDAAASVWRWYGLPFTPFLIFTFTYRWIEEGAVVFEMTEGRISVVIAMALVVAFCSAYILWKFLCAARYQRQLDELDLYGQ